MRHARFSWAVAAVLGGLGSTAWAASDDADDPDEDAADAGSPAVEPGTLEITVVGDDARAVADVPGSAAVITAQDLAARQPLHAAEALRHVPGVSVVAEDPMGLRLNIGFRGLNPIRSAKVLVLEDGVPIALAPYGEPALYYAPPIERIERIEVVKGSGSILHGPQTIGGVVNLITPRAPDRPAGGADARVGSHGQVQGRGWVGGTQDGLGWRLGAGHQRFGGPRDLDLRRTDFDTRIDWRLGHAQTLLVKVGAYTEASSTSYLGLTTAQYLDDPTTNLTPDDLFAITRFGGMVRHAVAPSPRFALATTFYVHDVQRSWLRQDYARSDDGTQVLVQDAFRSRNRHFTVVGLEPRAVLSGTPGPLRWRLTTGVRGHLEWVDQVIPRYEDLDAVRSGRSQIIDAQERTGTAVAAFGLAEVGDRDERVVFSPGLRVEQLWTHNAVTVAMVQDAATGEETPEQLDPPWESTGQIRALLPGAGLRARLGGPLSAFAGAHKGFAPPRTKDSIDSDGTTVTLEAEWSWNYEAGLRVLQGDWLLAELSGFVLDFDNQVIAPSEAFAGTAGADGLINGGETLHRGVEAAARLDVPGALGWTTRVPVSVSATRLQATFGEGWSADIQGNPLPYAPELQVVASVGLEGARGLGGSVSVTHVGAQTTDVAATIDPSADGTVGRIEAATLLDAAVRWTSAPTGFGAHLSVKNVLDTQTIASRSPAGIQPGLPRQITAGLQWER